jgi:hypothetical protein
MLGLCGGVHALAILLGKSDPSSFNLDTSAFANKTAFYVPRIAVKIARWVRGHVMLGPSVGQERTGPQAHGDTGDRPEDRLRVLDRTETLRTSVIVHGLDLS